MIKYVKEIGNLSDIKNTHVRTAIRGIIVKDDNILLIRTSKGDLKFPGGGLEGNEMYEEALIREIREETGYKIFLSKREMISPYISKEK